MGSPINSSKVGKEISDALGLKNVIDMDISLHLKEGAKVTVTYFPDAEDFKRVGKVLKKYKFVPIKEAQD